MKVPLPIRAIPALSFRAWLTPPPIGSRTLERDRVAIGDLEPIQSADIAGFEVGSGPLVLALHGWGGRPAQMAAISRALADAGHRVLIPELPGAAGGPQTDIKQAAATLRSLIDEFGQPRLVVGHSFAGMVMRLAFSESAPRSVALIAPALDVRDALDVFGDRLGLLPWARRGLRRRLEAWDPDLWPVVADLRPDQMPGAEILVLHDPEDRETPYRLSTRLAAVRPGTTVIPVPDAGHSKILTDPFVIDRVVRFVTSRIVTPAGEA